MHAAGKRTLGILYGRCREFAHACIVTAMTVLRLFCPFCLLVAHIVHASLLCDVTHYGAIGDAKTQNIGAFRSAIEACASGGVVRVPSPGIFLAAPFNLSSHQILEVQRGATLLGTTNVSLVPLMQPFPSMGGDITRDGHPCRYAPLVGAFNETNVSVTGGACFLCAAYAQTLILVN